MLKKLVAGTLVAGFALTGGLGAVSAEEKVTQLSHLII